MGCCNKDETCSKEAEKKDIPWFRMLLGTIMLLVFLLWD